MSRSRAVRHYLGAVISGGIALMLVYLYDGGIRLPYFESKSGWAMLQMTVHLSWLDGYLLVNLLITLPIIRLVYSRVFSKAPVKFETYKDRALKLHHADAQANHRHRKWSANGVTANPWEYTHATTQSYEGLSDSLFNLVKNLFLNGIMLFLGPFFLLSLGIKGWRRH